MTSEEATPLRFKAPHGKKKHPNGTSEKFIFGVYFPLTDLVVTDMGGRGTGFPRYKGIVWIDEPPKSLPWCQDTDAKKR